MSLLGPRKDFGSFCFSTCSFEGGRLLSVENSISGTGSVLHGILGMNGYGKGAFEESSLSCSKEVDFYCQKDMGGKILN